MLKDIAQIMQPLGAELPKKIGRRLSSVSYSLRKTSLKLAKFRPSPLLVGSAVMGISIFLLGGGIYDIFMGPLAILPIGSGRFLSFLPYRIHEQLLVGSIAIMVLYGLGALGLLLIYRSTGHTRNPHQVSLLLRIGVALLLVAFIAVEAELYWILHYPTSTS